MVLNCIKGCSTSLIIREIKKKNTDLRNHFHLSDWQNHQNVWVYFVGEALGKQASSYDDGNGKCYNPFGEEFGNI